MIDSRDHPRPGSVTGGGQDLDGTDLAVRGDSVEVTARRARHVGAFPFFRAADRRIKKGKGGGR